MAARRLLHDVFFDAFRADLGSVDGAFRIRNDAFGRARPGSVRHRVRDECGDDTVPDVSYSNASRPARTVLRRRSRLGIGDIDVVVLVDENSAGPAELRPLLDEVCVL